MPELVRPSAKYKSSFIEAVREAQAAQSGLGDTLKWNLSQIEQDFDVVLHELTRFEPGNELPDGFVHSEYLWLVKGGTYLGRVSIRHTLNERLREFGGHIGYEIRPTQRRRGYATLALKLALKRCRELGLSRVLLSCDDENVASWRVMQANGGVCEGVFTLDFYDKPPSGVTGSNPEPRLGPSALTPSALLLAQLVGFFLGGLRQLFQGFGLLLWVCACFRQFLDHRFPDLFQGV